MYNCMFVSALPDPTCNSEKSANGGNKQNNIIIIIIIIIIIVVPITCDGKPLCHPVKCIQTFSNMDNGH